MTLGEIYAVMWATTYDSRAQEAEEGKSRMYKLLKKIKGKR
jgi:hypothetical protein